MKQEFRIAGELWYDIDGTVGDAGGVYKLFCRVGNKRKSISRLLTSDKAGVLYIGKKSSSHECGTRYKLPPLNRVG